MPRMPANRLFSLSAFSPHSPPRVRAHSRAPTPNTAAATPPRAHLPKPVGAGAAFSLAPAGTVWVEPAVIVYVVLTVYVPLVMMFPVSGTAVVW